MVESRSVFNRFIVVFGQEDLLIDRHLSRAAQSRRRVIKLDGKGLTGERLVEILDTYDEAPRTVLLNNAQVVNELAPLSEFLDRQVAGDRSLILVAAVRTARLDKVWERAASLGKRVECAQFKPYDDKAFIDFVVGEGKRLEVTITTEVAALLFERVGPDLYRLANEMQKLAVYTRRSGVIKAEDVLAVSTATPRIDPYVIADMVAQGDVRRALNRLGLLCASESEAKAMLVVLNALMRKFEQLTVIRALQLGAIADEEIAGRAGLHPWVYKTRWMSIAKRWDVSALVERMRRLCELDALLKSGDPGKRTLFEMGLCELAKEGVKDAAVGAGNQRVA